MSICLPNAYRHQKIKNKKTYAFLLSFLCLSCVYSQEISVAAGADATGTGGTVSFSIGQVAYTFQETGISLSQGVQQMHRIPFATMVGINLRLSIYPNPVTDKLFVEILNDAYAGLQYRLYSSDGKLLISKAATGNQTGIGVRHLAAGLYVLEVMQKNRQVKSFKVIKTNP